MFVLTSTLCLYSRALCVCTHEHSVFADGVADVADARRLSAGHGERTAALSDLKEEVTQHQDAMFSQVDFRVELDAVQPPPLVGDA